MRKEYIKPEIEAIVVNGGRLLNETSVNVGISYSEELDDDEQVGVKGNILWDYDDDDWYD